MIIVRLQGGLGNQMFQYAAARAIAGEKTVYLDTSFFKINSSSTDSFTARNFELGIFRQLAVRCLPTKIAGVFTSRTFRKLFSCIFCFVDDHNISDRGRWKSSIYLNGYFQDAAFFVHDRQRLLKAFEFPALKGLAADWLKLIKQTPNAVSVHIRRGDYLKPEIMNVHGLLPLDYYRAAMAITDERVKYPVYFVFSDDINWCKQSFCYQGQPNIYYVDVEAEAWVDMALIRHCCHHIIANSSFSWWGAWLGASADSIVIAPQHWYKKQEMGVQYPSPVLAEWIKI